MGIATTSKAYKLLFRNAADSANCSYWLASLHIGASAGYAGFGMRVVYSDGDVGRSYLWGCDGGANERSYGVRAVVPVE